MKKQLYVLIFCAVVSIQHKTYASQTLYPGTGNAIRDNLPPDGIPDELAPYARNYVVKSGWVHSSPDRFWESRTYIEFDLSSIVEPFTYAEFQFTAFRYNTPHIPDQVVEFYGYPGDGQISLDDWFESGIFMDATDPIKGFEEDRSNRGEPIVFSRDISASFSNALNQGWSHLGIFFLNPHISTVRL